MGMNEAKLLCNKYGGDMTIITGRDLQEKLFLSMDGASASINCLREDLIWTGFSDEKVEGNFTDLNEGRSINDMINPVPFRLSQPNGDRAENCVAARSMYPYEISWFDTYCYRKNIPTFCSLHKNPRIQIRGNR